jgi:endogenous inhibitor of DNA gyrase (YacG/DUF329 family)
MFCGETSLYLGERWDLEAMGKSKDALCNSSAASCPICKEPLPAEPAYAPFCSKRCKQIDLGKWLGGDYAITRPVEERDLDEA